MKRFIAILVLCLCADGAGAAPPTATVCNPRTGLCTPAASYAPAPAVVQQKTTVRVTIRQRLIERPRLFGLRCHSK